jgi:hypothetical protein
MKAMAAWLVILVAILPVCESSGHSLRRPANFKDVKPRNEAFNSMLLSMQGLQFARLYNECSSVHCSHISKVIKHPLSLRGGEQIPKGEQDASSLGAQASDTMTADQATNRLFEQASVHEKCGDAAAGDTGEHAAEHEAENIDGDSFADDAVDDGIQMPIDDLVAFGRVAIAEQNYSLAADYLSAAVRKQVITRLCATHSLMPGGCADSLSP